MLRAALGVLIGFASMAVISIGTDKAVQIFAPAQFGANGDVHSFAMLVFILTYTLFYCMLGGYIAAVFARGREMGSAMILATLVVMMTIVNLTLVPSALPLWWKVAALVLAGPLVLAGAWVRVRAHRSPVDAVA
ncbi:MAG TPA: hypothetical protein VGF59_34330 [Bryobacteraceae bacterium]